MRDLLIFVLVVGAVFFGVGEWQGWYLGFPGSTPVLLYKRDAEAVNSLRTVLRNDMPISVSGQVRRGSVQVQISYERPSSFQTGGSGTPERVIFEQTYNAGQTIALSQTFEEGGGIYRLRMTYRGASGLFRFGFPRASEL